MADGLSDTMKEQFRACGHEHVHGAHTSTLEVTTDDYLTPAGDCIIGIDATKAPTGFRSSFVDACRDESATITTTFATADIEETIEGRGDPRLSFSSPRSAVWRTSEYVDDRTVAIACDGAAADLSGSLIDALANGADLHVTISVTN